MNNYTIILSFLFILIGIKASGQTRCATEERYRLIREKYPGIEDRSAFESWLQNKKNDKNRLRAFELKEFQYIIPVVVHVIHNGEAIGTGSNISDEQIFSQIEVINEDFRRLNKDTINTPAIFKPVAAGMDIEFKLAKRDPNGLPSDGIVRVYNEQETWNWYTDEKKIKSLSYWPAEDYLNIWIVNDMNDLAFATFPVSSLPGINDPTYDELLDGIVIVHNAFGSIDKGKFNLMDKYNKGRTLTHEIGHMLGLRHIWGDVEGSCSYDDFCDDTPMADRSTSGCPGLSVSCGSEDMIQNYMDYTDDRCMNLFTQCQKSRMITVLENSPRRLSWQYSLGAVPPPGYGNDLRITKIISPTIISCDNEIFPQIKLLNSGTKVINDFKIAYQIDDLVKDTIVYSGYNIAPGEQREINFPSVALTNDQHEFEVKILTVEGEEDTDTSNNHKKVVFTVNNDHDFIPLKETFTYEDAGDMKWSLINPDNQITWARVKTETGNFAASVNAFNYASVGSEDWLISPVLDFSNTMEASMQFSISYAYRENYNDLLKIMVSTDCGNSLFTMYEKFTRSLAVGNKDDAWEPSSERDWEKEFIDLSDFAGEERVRIAFVFINGNSNNIFIDDIEFFTSANPDAIVLKEKNSCQIYPNPSDQSGFNLAFNLDERDEVEISILDAIGRILMFKSYPNTINQTYHFQLTSFKPGVYFVQVKSNYFNMTKPVIFY